MTITTENRTLECKLYLVNKIRYFGELKLIQCSFFNYQEFSDEIIKKHGKKQKKQGFKGFFSWLDQYI